MPSSTVSDIADQVSQNMTSFAPITTFLIGLLVAFLVIEFLVSILKPKEK